MFNPVRAEEMAFAMSLFVSAAHRQVFSSSPPDVAREVREKRTCQRFLSCLAFAEEDGRNPDEAVIAQDSALFRATFAVWEHSHGGAERLSLVARVLAFHFLMERTQGAVLERWCNSDPEGEETVLLHPAVVDAMATVSLHGRGQLQAEAFEKAVEAAAETHCQGEQVPLPKRQTETAECLWPLGEGELITMMRRFDWSATSLGPVTSWPQSLKTAADLMLACNFPMIVLWGPELTQLYNDSYRQVMGHKHPAGLGQPTRRCWPEVWKINEPIYARVRQGESITFEDQLYPIVRYGFPEDAYFTLCYSPLRNEQAQVQGVLVTVFETTDRVLEQQAARRTPEATSRDEASTGRGDATISLELDERRYEHR